MEIIAFAVLALVLVFAIARLTAGRRKSPQELGRGQAARESRQILKELAARAGDTSAAAQVAVDRNNRIVPSDLSRKGQRTNAPPRDDEPMARSLLRAASLSKRFQALDRGGATCASLATCKRPRPRPCGSSGVHPPCTAEAGLYVLCRRNGGDRNNM